jgi:hypothetical protein
MMRKTFVIVAVVLLALLSTVCLAAIPYQTDRERAGLLGPIESVRGKHRFDQQIRRVCRNSVFS